MTARVVTSLLSGSEPEARRKRVLLVDESTATRDLRADTMRKLGMEVDCAVDIGEARLWWKADLYHLVLLSVENTLGHRDKFCQDIGSAVPPQQFAFLVGKPEYLAGAPNVDEVASLDGAAAPQEDVVACLEASQDSPLRWGIMEASRRISEVRSVAAARTKAMRDRPIPSRDMETRDSRRMLSQIRTELQKEGML